MKNVNTVKIDELSDEQILAARARRSRERCAAAAAGPCTLTCQLQRPGALSCRC
jgi:hypothetical protein